MGLYGEAGWYIRAKVIDEVPVVKQAVTHPSWAEEPTARASSVVKVALVLLSKTA
jgi:hypothetical protein